MFDYKSLDKSQSRNRKYARNGMKNYGGYIKRKKTPWWIIVLLVCLVIGVIACALLFYNYKKDVKVPIEDAGLDIRLQTEVQNMENENTAVGFLDEKMKEKEENIDVQIQAYLDDMTLEDKISSILIVTADDLADIQIAVQAGEQTKQRITQYKVGGIHYTEHNFENIEQMSKMISNINVYSKYPIFFAADASVKQRVENSASTLLDIGIHIDASNDNTEDKVLNQWLLLENEGNKTLSDELKIVKLENGVDAGQMIREDAEMLYIPDEFESVFDTLLQQLQNGELSETMIDEKIFHILQVKMK